MRHVQNDAAAAVVLEPRTCCDVVFLCVSGDGGGGAVLVLEPRTCCDVVFLCVSGDGGGGAVVGQQVDRAHHRGAGSLLIDHNTAGFASSSAKVTNSLLPPYCMLAKCYNLAFLAKKLLVRLIVVHARTY